MFGCHGSTVNPDFSVSFVCTIFMEESDATSATYQPRNRPLHGFNPAVGQRCCSRPLRRCGISVCDIDRASRVLVRETGRNHGGASNVSPSSYRESSAGNYHPLTIAPLTFFQMWRKPDKSEAPVTAANALSLGLPAFADDHSRRNQ